MDFERSILNKTNYSFKHSFASGKYTHSPTPSAVDDAVLSHFRIEASPMQSLPGARESHIEVDRHGVSSSIYQPRDAEYHHNDKLMAMAEVVSDACYSQQAAYYPAITHHHRTHTHTQAVTRSYHHHPLTPATSPEDYNSPDALPSAPDVPTPAATPAEIPGDEVYDDALTEIDPEHDNRDNDLEITDNTSRALIISVNRQHQQQQQPADGGKFVPFCQFENPCRENLVFSNAFCRKTVSHIFGRNKTCTQLIPDELWIWYCRKHYQRCRYRVVNWALQQVLIVRETLDNFEKWGNIQCFSITLRKREQERNEKERRNNVSSRSVNVPSSRRRTTGRITASQAQKIIHKARATATGTILNREASQEPEVTSTGRRKSFPVNVASPVPEFLYAYLGEEKSFNDIRHIVNQIGEYIKFQHEIHNKEVSFPDIEILPVFTLEFLHSKGRTTDAMADDNISRRRRARDATHGYHHHSSSASASASVSASASTSVSRVMRDSHHKEGREVQYRPSSTLPRLQPLPTPLPRGHMHSHSTRDAHAHTHGHMHLSPLAPPVHMRIPFGEF
jgi:hypothetical protein